MEVKYVGACVTGNSPFGGGFWKLIKGATYHVLNVGLVNGDECYLLEVDNAHIWVGRSQCESVRVDTVRENKIDVIREILSLVEQRQQNLEENVPEWMQGFEDLVYVQPDILGASVPLKNLTQAQLDFICGYFNLSKPHECKTHFSCLRVGDRYFSAPTEYWKDNYNLSFNDLFISKS